MADPPDLSTLVADFLITYLPTIDVIALHSPNPSLLSDADCTDAELRTLTSYLLHPSSTSPATTAETLLSPTTAVDDMDTKSVRVPRLLADAIAHSPDLHPPLYTLVKTLEALETAPDSPYRGWNVSGQTADSVGESWRIGQRLAKAEDEGQFTDEYITGSAWAALRCAQEDNTGLLYFALDAITYGLETQVPFPEDEGLMRAVGPNRAVPAAAWWIIRAEEVLWREIGAGRVEGWGPTAEWPEEKGSKVTVERWRVWGRRLRGFEESEDTRLDGEVKTVAGRALVIMQGLDPGVLEGQGGG